MQFTFLKGQRNVKLLIFNEHIYTLHSENNNAKRWRFSQHTCNGFILINYSDVIIYKNDRNHLNEKRRYRN